MRARYRNKLGKIIVELEYEGKWYYIKTLANPLTEFKELCLKKCLELDSKSEINSTNTEDKVPLIEINRNPDFDTKEEKK